MDFGTMTVYDVFRGTDAVTGASVLLMLCQGR